MTEVNRPFLDGESSLDDSFELERYPNDGDDTFTENRSAAREYYILSKSRLRLQQLYEDKVEPNIGIILLIFSQFFNSIMILTTKLLETDPDFHDDPIHPFQILVVRMTITFIGCVIYLKHRAKVTELFGPRDVRWLLVLRGVVGFTSVFSIYYSVIYLSISDATTISFLVPSITGFLAWIILREHWSLVEAVGSIVSLSGVVLIARPTFIFGEPNGKTSDGVESSDPKARIFATVVALFGVLGTSGVYIVVRSIGKRVHSLVTVEYFSLITTILSLFGIIVVPGLSFKIPQTTRQWLLFATLGIAGFVMQFLLTEGIMRETAGRASSMLYTQMIFALLWEVIIYHHLPNIWSWMGTIIILGSAFVVIYLKPKDSKAADTENIIQYSNLTSGEVTETTDNNISLTGED